MEINDPLRHPKIELLAASNAIFSMISAKSLDEFEIKRKEFLGCIEKVWIKTERSCQEIVKKFQPWQGKYSALRKKDMLLRYLKQARDADNHSIQDITAIKPGSRTIRPLNPHERHIKHMKIEN